MSLEIATAEVPVGLGFQAEVELPATRYRQGDLPMYDVIVNVPALTRAVRMPDPAVPLDDNRIVSEPRARRFGIEYVLDVSGKHGWICPPLTVRINPGDVKVKQVVAEFADGSAWVVLTLPAALLWQILDGQHRALGFSKAIEQGHRDIAKLREHIKLAVGNGTPPKHIRESEQKLTELEGRLHKIETSHVSVTMMVATSDQGRQAFVDIARNAVGVNPDFTVVLDQRSPVHRIAMDVAETHPLLVDRVESGQAGRISRTSPKLMGAKTVADIVHASLVGSGRVSKRLHDEISREETRYKAKVVEFFDSLVAGFTTMQDIIDESTSPETVRRTSLLGSSTMLRVLAIVWHDLREQGISAGSIERFWNDLAPKMTIGPNGIEDTDGVWMPTGAFLPGSAAPQARQGSVTGLASAIRGWYPGSIPVR